MIVALALALGIAALVGAASDIADVARATIIAAVPSSGDLCLGVAPDRRAQTGDVAGTAQQMAEIGVYLVFAARAMMRDRPNISRNLRGGRKRLA